jgi:hypothetical protein
MPFVFRNLDPATRVFMVEEIEAATRDGNLYFSKRFTPSGTDEWPALLLEAARDHNEHWLAYQLEVRGFMKGLEGSRTPSGGYTIKHVPNIAAETMAEGQFNRYYILGVCRRAIAEGKADVWVYRAKQVLVPRPESETLIGKRLSPSELIGQMRPVDSSLGHELLKPNSGLSVHL